MAAPRHAVHAKAASSEVLLDWGSEQTETECENYALRSGDERRLCAIQIQACCLELSQVACT
eukprot:5786782-Pleurochrysis_carterae.AAC.1